MAERTSHYDSWLHLESRIELHSDDGTVSRLFKQADLKTDVLGRVFRLQRESVYLEEDRSKNAEFPNDAGGFDLGDLPGTKYTVHGEPIESDMSSSDNGGVTVQPVWRTSSVLEATGGAAGTSGCTVKPPAKSPAWSLGHHTGRAIQRLANPLSLSARRKHKEPSITKNISYVKLTVPFGANKAAPEIVGVEANVYIKVAENAISASEILTEAACRIPGTPLVEELILLDSKMVPVCDEHPPFDIDYWKAPSRRFYIARVEEYNEVMSNIRARRKRKTSSCSDQHEPTMPLKEELVRKLLHTIEQVKSEVSALRNQLQMCSSIAQMFDCKICKQIPTSPPVYLQCCKQILGCKTCFEGSIASNTSCPLCRNSDPSCSDITGMESILEALRSYSDTFLSAAEDGQ